jgi:hypothetical protein
MKPLFFYQQRKHTVRQTLISIVLVILSGSMLYLFPGFLCYIFFGFLFLLGSYGLFRLSLSRPTVTVTSEGIKSSGNGMGFIPWEFITGFEIKEGVNFNAIVIMLSSHDEFFNDKGSLITKIMTVNIKRFGSPIVLSESLFHVSLSEAVEILQQYKTLQETT